MMALRLPYRLQQVVRVASASSATIPSIPESASARLTEPMLHQFRILLVADQLHLLRVHNLLEEMGAEEDTIRAGLIHDVGKACAKCRITILDRALHVIFTSIAPWTYRKFAAIETAPGWIRGLHRLANHAERGALAASQAGYNDRVIELIRRHETGSDRNDAQLRLLRNADDLAERA